MIFDSLKGRNLLTLQDLSPEEIEMLLRLAAEMKMDRAKYGGILSGKSIALIFEKPSTRTRVSMEVAAYELGANPIYLRSDELQLARGEEVSDTARTLSRYVHMIVARVKRHGDLEELARWATVPVVNALSDLDHPLQTLADLLTIWEVFGRLKGLKIAWIGDGNNVCNSTLIGASKLGIDISVAAPKGYEPDKKYLEFAVENARKSGCRVEVLEDPAEAVKDADIVMTDVFVSMGMEAEREIREKVFFPRYRVDAALMSKAKPGAVFMHPLPAQKGREVAREVIEGERSVVWAQAENRLHTAKAVFLSLLASPAK